MDIIHCCIAGQIVKIIVQNLKIDLKVTCQRLNVIKFNIAFQQNTVFPVIYAVGTSIIITGNERLLQFIQCMSFGHKHTVQNKAITAALFCIHFQQMPHGIMPAAFAVVKLQFTMLVFIKMFCQMLIISRSKQ